MPNHVCTVNPLQDSDLTWYTPDPDFTPCFLKTVLVYAPCIFLVVFAPLDIHYARISKYADIPWSWNNCTRLLLNVLLIAVAVADIIVAATWEDGIDQFDVHLVTPAVKIVTFVSVPQLLSEFNWFTIYLHFFLICS